MSVMKGLCGLVLMMTLSHTFASNINEGFHFSPERLVYLESNAKGISAGLQNGTSKAALIQAQIVPTDLQTGLPLTEHQGETHEVFLITPPLHKLDINERFNWRIQRVNDGKLATDKETVFYVALKVIPESNANNKASSQFILAPTIYLKMLYRPQQIEELRLDAQTAKLDITAQGSKITINNPTPLSMTLASLSVGSYDVPVEKFTHGIAPFGQQVIFLEKNVSGTIKWRVLNEYSIPTKVEVRGGEW
ncbi:fimbria/pilus periplasmic chaperone [Providencia alcalifaciens]|uniref:fimbrial biogenesis chaperone n=1 Tax=Providencia alcalifaciens TaxID=126385 RepID=UPI001CE08C3F|nr:fimbria/pilus periplasmic chaperone [Providencia alcalifaciens]UBX47613.1 fimbria/pilus periplasmic chaperone [Providencia alcalifaciens]